MKRKAATEFTYDRTFAATWVSVPVSVELLMNGSVLCSEGSTGSERRHARNLLPALCNTLPEAEPERYRAFAERWGMLELCVHEIPVTYCESCWGSHDWERIVTWRRFASAVRALLAISVDLYRNQSGSEADWRAVELYTREGLYGGDVMWERSTADQWWTVGMVVHDWFQMAGDNLRIIPRGKEGGGLSLDLEAYGLHAIVVREVAFTIGRFSGLAFCDGCGDFYTPKRKPRADRHNFCETCGKRESWKLAQRKRRAAKKAAAQS